ncbi:MAG: hypothetical protein ABIQ31_12880 [Ferruginibacter sp.]
MFGFGRKKKPGADSAQSADKAFDPTPLKKKTDEILGKISTDGVSAQESEWLKNVYRVVVIKKHFTNPPVGTWRGTYAIIALVCLVLGGLLLFFRVGDIPAIGFLSTNNVSIQVRCKALQISLKETERQNILGFDGLILTDRLEINKLNSIAVSDTRLSFNDTAALLNAKLNADTIFLDKIEVGAASVLKIKQLQDMVHINVKGEPLKVSASFNSAEFLEPVKEKVQSKQQLDIPLFARFESTGKEDAAADIIFRHKGVVNILEGRKVSSLLFSDSYVYGADILKYISTIQSGTLTLNDVNRSVELNKQDRFILQDINGWLIDFSVENNVISLFFKGTVKGIKAGPDGSEKDLRPRLLEYLLKNQPLALFWGAVVFLWGLISSIISRLKLS